MAVKIKEIYYLPVKLGNVSYNRPCIVIYVGNNLATVGLLSSAMDLYNEHLDFLIRDDHLDFQSTGLKKSCFVKGNPFIEVPLSDFRTPIGSIVGEMSKCYDEWLG